MIRSLVILLAVATAGSALALTPAECTRVTHVSHGGEADHVDLGEGRVMWTEWWSQEGTSELLNVMDCATGQQLMARTQEENMSDRLPVDRTEDALGVIARHESGSRIFATLDRIAADLDFARDVSVITATNETCACAAFYPQALGNKTEFRLEGL